MDPFSCFWIDEGILNHNPLFDKKNYMAQLWGAQVVGA
jgi:hypothetical protein